MASPFSFGAVLERFSGLCGLSGAVRLSPKEGDALPLVACIMRKMCFNSFENNVRGLTALEAGRKMLK
jgi:hypothetical protein